MVCLLAERNDTKSNVMLGGFQSQLQSSYVSSHTEELWYNEKVCLWMTIYITCWFLWHLVSGFTHSSSECIKHETQSYRHHHEIYIYIYIYIYKMCVCIITLLQQHIIARFFIWEMYLISFNFENKAISNSWKIFVIWSSDISEKFIWSSDISEKLTVTN